MNDHALLLGIVLFSEIWAVTNNFTTSAGLYKPHKISQHLH